MFILKKLIRYKHGFGKMFYPSGNYYEGHW
jgi:hypothetical protein